MNPVQVLFPKYAAAAMQVGNHGAQAYIHASHAVKAPAPAQKLDAVVRAGDSFDHSITASRRLPLGLVVGGTKKYYAGYAAAKAATTLLVGSGLIPGARERVGRQEITAAREHFFDGVATYANEGRTRYGRALAKDWMGSSIEDAGDGLFMLRRPDLAKPLLQGLFATSATIDRKREIDKGQVSQIDSLFKQALGAYDQLIATAASVAGKTKAGAPTATDAAKAMAAADATLAPVVADAPTAR